MLKKVSVTMVLFAFIIGCVGILPAMAAEKIDVRKVAEDLAQYLVSTRRMISQMVDVINTHGAKVEEPLPKDAPYAFKGVIPAYMGRIIGDDFFKNSGIRVKQTTLGKGEYGVRNTYNTADDWEKEVLTRFYEPSYPKGKGYGEEADWEGKKVYRYMLPLYIEKSCLKCHGDPATSPTGDGKDMAGKAMGNYLEGEIRGGVSGIIPFEEKT